MLGMWIKSSSSVCRSEMLDAGIREERRVEWRSGKERVEEEYEKEGRGRASSGEDHLNEKYYTSRTHPHLHGSPVRAAALFDTAHCARCHRFTLYPSSPPSSTFASTQVYKRVVDVRTLYLSACACNNVVSSISLYFSSTLFFLSFLLPSFFFFPFFYYYSLSSLRQPPASNGLKIVL